MSMLTHAMQGVFIYKAPPPTVNGSLYIVIKYIKYCFSVCHLDSQYNCIVIDFTLIFFFGLIYLNYKSSSSLEYKLFIMYSIIGGAFASLTSPYFLAFFSLCTNFFNIYYHRLIHLSPYQRTSGHIVSPEAVLVQPRNFYIFGRTLSFFF